MYKVACGKINNGIKAMGWTQEDAAVFVGVSRSRLNQYLNRPDAYPDKQSQDKIMRVFKSVSRDDMSGPVGK
jgi:transcriptional regulator with XRE-family HTH domain